MVTIGVDAHKRMHMAQALDDAERVIDQWRGLNTPDGWRDVAAWAQGVGSPRQWGHRGGLELWAWACPTSRWPRRGCLRHQPALDGARTATSAQREQE